MTKPQQNKLVTYRARQTLSKRQYRKFQQQIQGRMPEQTLVQKLKKGKGINRRMADNLQRSKTVQQFELHEP